ncbi:MAG: LeoA/HP0731 family dynamin-like GTPase, partial [Gluconobacter cerinus]
INNTSILAARDALNLGIKFKPYGAIKLAAKANVALAAVGPAIEGFRMIKKILDNREFEQTRAKIISALEEQRNDLTEVLKASDFTDVHFPQLAQMQALFETIRRGAAEARDYAEQIQKWAEKGRELCHRFGIQAPELPDESHIIDV